MVLKSGSCAKAGMTVKISAARAIESASSRECCLNATLFFIQIVSLDEYIVRTLAWFLSSVASHEAKASCRAGESSLHAVCSGASCGGQD